MLGWFKKKFGKKEAPSATETTSQEVLEEPISQQSEVPAQNVEDLKPAAAPITESITEKIDPQLESSTTKNIITPEKVTAPVDEPEPVVPADTASAESKQASETPQEESVKRTTPQQTTPISKPTEKAETEQSTTKKDTKDSLFSRLTSRLGKTRESFTHQMDALFLGKKEIDSDLLDSLEEILITADLGVETSEELIDYARNKIKRKELLDPNALKDILKKQIKKLLLANDADATLVMPKSGPFVIMVIGVNGVGKTTTIGKMAHKFKQAGNSVMLVAADTFRAGAVSQLKIWGERNDVPVIAHHEGADPSSVVFDALSSAVASKVDVVIVDTAGRMHTKENLMEELKKIKRVIGKKMRGAPHEVMLVIDATTGQNGISQARLFDAAVDLTGLTLTKLDGTSKGGIVANICRDIKIPIRFIGIGEQMDDLRDFDATEFVDALFQSDN
ncbi:MAG: fused signal recognition particle receptor [Desulforhopalus sp.]|jgi:fused signal recognition particle receptor